MSSPRFPAGGVTASGAATDWGALENWGVRSTWSGSAAGVLPAERGSKESMNQKIAGRSEMDAYVGAITDVTEAAFRTLEIGSHTEQFIVAAMKPPFDHGGRPREDHLTFAGRKWP